MNINPTEDEKISSKGDSSSEDGCSEDEVEVVTVQIRFTAHILINTANNSLGLKRATQGLKILQYRRTIRVACFLIQNQGRKNRPPALLNCCIFFAPQ